jgi:hypothetical protein
MAGTASRFITELERSFQTSVPNGTQCGLKFHATQFFEMSFSQTDGSGTDFIQTTSCIKVRLSLQPIQYLTNLIVPSLILFMKIFSCMLFGCCRQCALVHFHA